MAVVIQAGHVNIGSNCNEGLRGETGAPGEAAYVSQIAAIVAGAIQAHGPVCIVADANFNCTQDVSRDYECVVALHCDGRDSSGFAVGVGDPSKDGAADLSAKLKADLRSRYAAATHLTDLDNLGNDPNVTEYYLFGVLSKATPFALIELGAIGNAEGQPGPDTDYLLSHTHDVADGIVEGVLNFLQINVPASAPAPAAPAPEPSPTPAPAAGGSPATNPLPQLTEQLRTLLGSVQQVASNLQTLLDMLEKDG